MKRPLILILVSALPLAVAARQLPLSGAVRPFIAVDAPVVALTNVRVIDGTGAPPRDRQTIVIRDGRIAQMGDAASVRAPDGATAIDLTGKTVIPGLVMVHEHLFYPTSPSPRVYGQLGASFTRLYLAGGVTSMRTAGNMNGIADEASRCSMPILPSIPTRRVRFHGTRPGTP